MQYRPVGVCSQLIEFELDGNTVKSVEFYGGCHGNAQGISSLVKGMDVDEVIARLEGIKCGYKPTSCPDQLAQALKLAKEQQ
ncbi:MAG: TIGR03905 family TSCPD domain-containing protein [Firmicutes bacterium]|nr:TIGR03905 family TSCPD domain-containing protein [Bacillota bacterium]